MTTKKQKLELTWIGKHNPEYDVANIEPRILEERTDFSHGDPNWGRVICALGYGCKVSRS